MDALYYIVITLFVFVCIMLVGVILLQSSQTGGMGSALAGNALNSAFGGQGADKLLVKITTILATLFMFFAVLLNLLSTPGSNDLRSIDEKSILNRNKIDSTIEVPIKLNEEENSKDTE